MRRELSSSPSKKRAAAPAAQAFYEAQQKAEAAEVASAASAEPLPELALDEGYAWDDEAPAELLASPAMAMPPPPRPPAPTGGFGGFGGAPPGGPPPDLYRHAETLHRARRQGRQGKPKMSTSSFEKTSEELQLEATGVQVIETGFFIWKNVIVPPNAYVVHTRRGRAEPVTQGLGKSFRYNPMTDSYLVVPAAMQTIGIFARCISAEKQGINVLAYVQWLISDFSLAYKRLDFSNLSDPMGIVNTQLKEQAEAAIKDTVATMTVEQVLKDKAPIIQELTERMKSVAEGRDGDGLGLKIVTVQIKEAMIASTTLWDNLQAPFRHQKAREARLSEIETEAEVHRRHREAQLDREAADAKAASEIAKLRAQVALEDREATLASQVRQEEIAQKAEQDERRYRQETELARIQADQRLDEERHRSELVRLAAAAVELRARTALDQERQAAELATERRAEDQRLALQVAADEATLARARAEAEIEGARQAVLNAKTPAALQGELVAVLPQIAAQMPEIQEYRYLGMGEGGDGAFDALPAFMAKALGVANAFGLKLPTGGEPSGDT